MPTGSLLGGGRLVGSGEGVLRNRAVLGGLAGQQGSARGRAGPVEAGPGLHSGVRAWRRLSRKAHGSPDLADVHWGGGCLGLGVAFRGRGRLFPGKGCRPG